MKLYFMPTSAKRRYLGYCPTKEDVLKEINKFLDEHNYKSYYIRTWREENEVWIDVESWSEFFIVEDEEGEWGEI